VLTGYLTLLQLEPGGCPRRVFHVGTVPKRSGDFFCLHLGLARAGHYALKAGPVREHEFSTIHR